MNRNRSTAPVSSRREVLGAAGLLALTAGREAHARPVATPSLPLLRAPRLEKGDAVSLVSPAGSLTNPAGFDAAVAELRELGLRPKVGRNVKARRGYFAGSDEARLADLNAAFEDPETKAVLAVRGGWGCARLLPYVNYDAIAERPKVIMGYSDITSLLQAVHTYTGLVTFHGPNVTPGWTRSDRERIRRMLFQGEAVTIKNEAGTRVRTIARGEGVARGKLLGGNLTVLSSIIGSVFVPDFRDAILFLEDIGEEPYRIDRMLTQLSLAGLFGAVSGVAFGQCSNCTAESPGRSLTLEQVLEDHLAPLGIPVVQGLRVGHVSNQHVVPVGAPVELDADAGTLRLLAPAVASTAPVR